MKKGVNLIPVISNGVNNKVLIFGKGFLGSRIQKELGCEITDRWINVYKDAEEELDKYKPDIVINCVGYIGKNNVDDCEKDIDFTLKANVFVPVILAEACLRENIKFIHISSGCIYDFDYSKPEPVKETDQPYYFKLFYSRTKIYSEKALVNLSEKLNVLILRLRIPLDNRNHPKNIISKLIRFKRIIDVPNSITYIPDFIEALKYLIKIDARGLFNVTNKGALRYPELMDVYKKYRPDFQYEIIALKDLKLDRTNLILSTEKLEKTGFKMRKIQDILEECVKGFINS